MGCRIWTTRQSDLVSCRTILFLAKADKQSILITNISGSKPIDEARLKEISNVVEEAGVPLQKGGWEGGIVWLVPTDRPIDQWKPIATRKLE